MKMDRGKSRTTKSRSTKKQMFHKLGRLFRKQGRLSQKGNRNGCLKNAIETVVSTSNSCLDSWLTDMLNGHNQGLMLMDMVKDSWLTDMVQPY